jgi:integrase
MYTTFAKWQAVDGGLRISEMLGLVWADVDFAAGLIHVRAQLPRARRDAPAKRVAPQDSRVGA